MPTGIREKFEFVSQAIITRSPASLMAGGIAFTHRQDDLNAYQVAELMLGDLPFALVRHEGTPADEMELYIPDSVPPGAMPSTIQRIAHALGLPADAVTWQRRDADIPN